MKARDHTMRIPQYNKKTLALSKSIISAALVATLLFGLCMQSAMASTDPVIQRAGRTGGINAPSRTMTMAEFLDEYKGYGFVMRPDISDPNDMAVIDRFFSGIDFSQALTTAEFFSRYAGLEFDLTWSTGGQDVLDRSGGKFSVLAAYHLTGNTASLPVLSNSPRIRIDGGFVQIAQGDQGPVILGGRTLVPLRAVMQELGFKVSWDGAARTVRLEKQGYTVIARIGSNLMTVNGDTIQLDVPAQIINNRTMVPLRAISEATGMTVRWDGETRIVDIHLEATPVAVEPMTLAQTVRDGKSHREILDTFPDISPQTLQDAFEQEVVSLVNVLRRERGVAPLTYHPDLAALARARAMETIQQNARHTHVSPSNGLAHGEYARSMGLNVAYAGESAVWGRLSPAEAVNSWMNSAAHREALLRSDRSVIYIGAGFYYGDGRANTAWTLWVMSEPR